MHLIVLRSNERCLKTSATRSFISLLVTNFVGLWWPARGKGTDHRRRHDIRQAARPSIPGGLCVLKQGQARLRLRAGFEGLVSLALSTATGRCWKTDES